MQMIFKQLNMKKLRFPSVIPATKQKVRIRHSSNLFSNNCKFPYVT